MAIDRAHHLDAGIQQAEELFGGGDAAGARELLDDLAVHPAATTAQRVRALSDLGVVMASGGQLVEAELRLLDALSRDRAYVPALEALAGVCEAAGDLVQATHWAWRAAEAESEAAGAWRRLAGLLLARRRFEQAREVLARARSLGGELSVETEPVADQRDHAKRDPRALDVRRVLILVDFFHPSLGGSERLAEAVGAALIAETVAVDVATRPLAGRTAHTHRGMPIHELSGDPLVALQQVLDGGEYDAILIFSAPGVWPLEAGLRLPAPRPRIVAVPCINAENGRTLRSNPVALGEYARVLATADVIGYSSLSGEDVRLCEELGLDGIYVPNASERLAPSDRSPDSAPAGGGPVLLMVANMWPEKNHLGLLRALCDHPGDWRLQIIGDASPEYPSLAEEVRELAREDSRVTILGPRGPDDVAAAMRSASILLLSSKAEATPLVLLEAMSVGLPWIATPTCGAAHDHAGGLILPLAMFGDGIDFLLDDKLRPRRLGVAGAAHWRSCYTWDVIGPRYAALLRGEPVGRLAPPRDPIAETDAVRAEFYDRRPSARRKTAAGASLDPGAPARICICVPTYNRAAQLRALLSRLDGELRACSESVMVLVADNASQDSTPDLLRAAAAERPWLTVHRHPANLGAAGNIEWLVTNAPEADYLWLLCDDDLVVEGGLRRMLDLLGAERPAWLFMPHIWVDEQGRRLGGSPIPASTERFDGSAEMYLAWHHWLTFASASVLESRGLREAVAATRTANAYHPLLWFFRTALSGRCVVAADCLIQGSADISWADRRHEYQTLHFTALYDEGLHAGLSAAEFGASLDGLYTDGFGFDLWQLQPLETLAERVRRFPQSRSLRRYLFELGRA
ncbi:MAG: glycosyltransferase, partial [Solirubrobacteraceae bacterium]